MTSHKSELCSHFETCFRHSATDSKVIAAVVAEPFLFSTAHSYVEITITVCASFAKGFFFLLSLNSQPALLPSTGFLWEHRTLVRWRRWRRRRRWLRQATLLASKRGEAERLTEPPSCCLNFWGVDVIEFTFLWALPAWIFNPFSDLKTFLHCSHLKLPHSTTFLTASFAETSSFPGESSSFFFRNSVLLLAFLLKVDKFG